MRQCACCGKWWPHTVIFRRLFRRVAGSDPLQRLRSSQPPRRSQPANERRTGPQRSIRVREPGSPAAVLLAWERRSYAPGDLRGAFLAIVSDTNPPATAPIYEEAQREKVLINAMDDVQHCTFVAGSVVRRGPLVISISTSGAAPALSVRLRERFEREIGPEYEEFLGLMAELREPMSSRYPSFAERREHWYRVVDSDVLDVLRDQGAEAAIERIAALTQIDLTMHGRR